jgi:L-ribulokinase
LLKGFTAKLFKHTYTADQAAGLLSAEWASRLGLKEGIVIGVGAFDAHMGAVGGQIEPYHLSKVMGTSTCDMLVAPLEDVKGKLIKGICGQVPGSVIPGMMGMEAGQSAFGDVYAWFKNLISWPLNNLLNESSVIDETTANALREEVEGKIIATLSKQAEALTDDDYAELAVDWLNGRRTPNANHVSPGPLGICCHNCSLWTEQEANFR